MKHFVLFACVAVGLIFAGCRNRQEPPVPVVVQEAEPKDTAVLEFPHPKEKQLTAADISLTKELLSKIPIHIRIRYALSNGMSSGTVWLILRICNAILPQGGWCCRIIRI